MVLGTLQETHGFGSFNDAMIVGQAKVHDGRGNDPTIADDGRVLHLAHPQHGALRRIDHRGEHQ